MNGNIKKKQHFVSQFYLKNWATITNECNKVFTNIKGSPILVNIWDIAHGNYFYKIDRFSKTEFNFLMNENQRAPELLKSLFETLMVLVYTEANLVKTANTKEILTNAIEEVYCIIEDMAAPDISLLLNRDYDTEITIHLT